MGLRCSVLGHRYGPRERIEERTEEGDEVLVTVRDVKTCERCGTELVVSESKEVTAAPGATPAPTDDRPTEPDEPASEPAPASESEMASDDAVIMDESPDAEKVEREPGEWPPHEEPDADEVESPKDPADWPAVDAEADEGFDAVSGEAAEEEDDETNVDEVIQAAAESHTVEADAEETEAGFVKAANVEAPADATAASILTEYYCPRCGWTRESIESSVRAGDICPDCRVGYIAERDVQ